MYRGKRWNSAAFGAETVALLQKVIVIVLATEIAKIMLAVAVMSEVVDLAGVIGEVEVIIRRKV